MPNYDSTKEEILVTDNQGGLHRYRKGNPCPQGSQVDAEIEVLTGWIAWKSGKLQDGMALWSHTRQPQSGQRRSFFTVVTPKKLHFVPGAAPCPALFSGRFQADVRGWLRVLAFAVQLVLWLAALASMTAARTSTESASAENAETSRAILFMVDCFVMGYC